jgi:hypothetical protein
MSGDFSMKAEEQDPYETEEYQRFVASMVPHCHCRESNRPCDGVLAGGVCDNQQEDEHDED